MVKEKEVKKTKKVKTKEVVKKDTKKQKNKEKEPFFKSVKAEMAKVKWPEAKDIVKYSVATLFICIFIGLFFQLVEFVSSIIKGLI